MTDRNPTEKQRIVIVGGVAGGASAAARARRLSEDVEIILLERGEYISFANCGLPYHIGGAIADRDRLLVQTPEAFHRRFRVDVRTQTEATRIDRDARYVEVRNRADGSTETLGYDALILSPGAEPVRPPIPGVEAPRVHTLRNMTDMDAIKRRVDDEDLERAVVVGGGYIGLEMAEALRERNVAVTLVELLPQVMGPADAEMAAPLHKHIEAHGVDLRLDTSVTAVEDRGETLEVQLSTGRSVEAQLVVMAVGVRPEIDLAREAGLEVGERGGIVVDEHMRTNDPAIYAVGDAVQVTDRVGAFPTLIPLAGPANRQGRIAADNALGRDSVYHDTQGTAVCKVFDMTIAMTGLNEKTLKQRGIAHEKVYVHPAHHAGYYPGAAPMSLKLLFAPADGRILGAQAVGTKTIDKRIDVLAVALRAGLTVYDLEHLELTYAPPYGSAKDPVNYAGFVAGNVLRGDAALCHTEDLLDPRDDQMLLDVRTSLEVKAGTIPGAVNIPLDELRERLSELPAHKELLVFCQVGLRGYLACRILTQHGRRCRNLTGGYKTFLMVTGATPAVAPAREVRDDTGAQAPTTPPEAAAEPTRRIDVSGLQCPGPIMRLAGELESLQPGQSVHIKTTDPNFAVDLKAWCHSTGHRLATSSSEGGVFEATVAKGGGEPLADTGNVSPHKKTLVVFSGDFDRVMASFIIANGAAAMGSEVTMFFTFWGLNALRRDRAPKVRKNPVEKMFGWMMPRGARRLKLSNMNMGGLGLAMIKGIMRRKNVTPLPDLIEQARAHGVRMVACTMSMDLMGIRPEELIEGVELGGVAMYLDHAEAGSVNLFV